jgi:hypothetical protein
MKKLRQVKGRQKLKVIIESVTHIGRKELTEEERRGLKIRMENLKAIDEATEKLHEEFVKKRQSEFESMNGDDLASFKEMEKSIQPLVSEMRMIVDALEAKKRERVWLANQLNGELDTNRLIEGKTGEKRIYKKRGEADIEPGMFQQFPKQILFAIDISASMFRFNSHDERLDRSLEIVLLIINTFKNYPVSRYEIEIFGHSGDSPMIPLYSNRVDTDMNEFKLLAKMKNHSKFCLSGDNTLLSLELLMKKASEREDAGKFLRVV